MPHQTGQLEYDPIMKYGLLSLWLLALPCAGWAGDSTGWLAVAEAVVQHIDQAEQAYLAGDHKQAKHAVVSAYFGVFEDRKMEAAMRLELGAKHTYLVEKKFGDLRKAIQKDAGGAEVSAVAESIRVAMRRDAALLDKAGIPLTVFKVNQ
ncbi:hypothetical protein [Sedimenticola sp.]|uniref:hypothetical protein n=1 Tax=Sedimenticola sp. TaxID=1940285 RepID=UPI003D0A2336